MRIYNKKKFLFGVFMIILGGAGLVIGIIRESFDIKSAIIDALLLLIGLGDTARSLSRQMSREDMVAERDERNKLICLKSKSRAFQVTQVMSCSLMLAFLAAGKISGYEGFTAMAVGLAFGVAISMFSELFTYWYYEKRN